MIYVAAVLGVLSFALALQLFRVVEVAGGAVEVSRDAAKLLSDAALTDEDRERALQRAALSLLRSFVSILVRGGAALGVSLVSVLVFHSIGLARFSEVMDLLGTWEAILAASVLMTLGYLVWTKIAYRT